MTNKYAQLFRDLADKIEKNDEADFGGAFLVVPPKADANTESEPLSGVFIGAADMGSFFGMIRTKLDVYVTLADDARKRMGAYGR